MARTWGRVNGQWQKVETDENGGNDAVWITTLIQTLKLNLGESPVFASHGIPAQKAVISQIFPDYYVAQVQQQYAQYFASLLIAKIPPSLENLDPRYKINLLTNQGTRIAGEIPA